MQAAYDAGSTMAAGGRTLKLAQFHFHAPSEQTIDGVIYVNRGPGPHEPLQPLNGRTVQIDSTP